MSTNATTIGTSELSRPTFSAKLTQYSTFLVAGHLYGVPVMRVREVVRPMPITAIPLANPFVHGLINLRGQVVTAVGLHRLFDIKSPESAVLMNVICENGPSLISLQADEIGDVIEMDSGLLEPVPPTSSRKVTDLLAGVYQMPNQILAVIDVDKIFQLIEQTKSI
ncbi:MAG: chemotaxis protein CheW [Proteobacteria bacterium]|nr:chemotaxis protein CheW [Pseudomonadota bacterium]